MQGVISGSTIEVRAPGQEVIAISAVDQITAKNLIVALVAVNEIQCSRINSIVPATRIDQGHVIATAIENTLYNVVAVASVDFLNHAAFSRMLN